MNYKIRRRQREDCARIAHVVTVAWNETYKGIVPDWFLEELKTNEPDRAKKTYDEYDVQYLYCSWLLFKRINNFHLFPPPAFIPIFCRNVYRGPCFITEIAIRFSFCQFPCLSVTNIYCVISI